MFYFLFFFASCANLTIFVIGHNHISKIPNEMGTLTALERFDLTGNDIVHGKHMEF